MNRHAEQILDLYSDRMIRELKKELPECWKNCCGYLALCLRDFLEDGYTMDHYEIEDGELIEWGKTSPDISVNQFLREYTGRDADDFWAYETVRDVINGEVDAEMEYPAEDILEHIVFSYIKDDLERDEREEIYQDIVRSIWDDANLSDYDDLWHLVKWHESLDGISVKEFCEKYH